MYIIWNHIPSDFFSFNVKCLSDQSATCLFDHSKCFRQNSVKSFTFCYSFFEFIGFILNIVIRQAIKLFVVCIDFFDDRSKFCKLFSVIITSYFSKYSLEHSTFSNNKKTSHQYREKKTQSNHNIVVFLLVLDKDIIVNKQKNKNLLSGFANVYIWHGCYMKHRKNKAFKQKISRITHRI